MTRKKKVLAIYYTQTGQLEEIMRNLTAGLQDTLREDAEITYLPIQMEKDFPFPWPSDVFYNTFPETYLQMPEPIKPISSEILNEDYDLILLGYQVWFLTPSIPIISFLKSPAAEKLLRNRPVVTISGTRNMWMLSQDKLKTHLNRLGAKLVGNIALVDRHNNYTSVITILNWLSTGKKEQPKPLPPAGIAQKEIDECGKFGATISSYVENGSYEGMQKALVDTGAVEVRPFLIKVEKVGNKLFTFFSTKVKTQPQRRTFWVKMFKFYLMTAIWVISPIVLFFYTLGTPLFYGKRQRLIQQYQGL